MANQKALEKRLEQIRKLASSQNISTEKIENLPPDNLLKIAAFATLLGMDALKALNTDISLEELEQEASKLLSSKDSNKETFMEFENFLNQHKKSKK